MLLQIKLTAILFSATFVSFCQSNTVASGGNATGSNGNVSFTVGQIDYTSQTGSSGKINQGVQHAYEIYGTNSLQDLGDLFQLTVGPNPTIDFLILTSSMENLAELSYYLTDLNGKKLMNPIHFTGKAEISMVNYPTGMYFLIMQNISEEIKSFKIIKTQ
jgi:hypothetical protein